MYFFVVSIQKSSPEKSSRKNVRKFSQRYFFFLPGYIIPFEERREKIMSQISMHMSEC